MEAVEFPKDWLDQGVQMLGWDTTELLEVLGIQLLAADGPRAAGGLVQYLGIPTLGRPERRADWLPSEALLPQSLAGLQLILEQSRARARIFMSTSTSIITRAVCTESGECQPSVAKTIDAGAEICLGTLVPLLARELGIPPALGSIVVTLTVLLLKTGLEDFCRHGFRLDDREAV